MICESPNDNSACVKEAIQEYENDDDQHTDKKAVPQFRGWWITVEIVELFQTGTINALETLLLATIDSFVSKERACWAGDAKLAAMMCCDKRSIRRMMKHLRDLGLVITVARNSRIREIETVWSQRRLGTHREEQAAKNDLDSSAECAAESGLALGRKCPSHRLNKNTNQVCVSSSSYGTRKHTRGPSGPGVRVSSLLVTEDDRRLATILRETLVRNGSDAMRRGGRSVSLSDIARTISNVRTQRGASVQQVEKIICWYSRAYGLPFVPIMMRLSDFCTKWGGINQAMKRFSQETTGVAVRHKFDDRWVEVTASQVREELDKRGIDVWEGARVSQKQVDDILVNVLHEPAGSVPVGRV